MDEGPVFEKKQRLEERQKRILFSHKKPCNNDRFSVLLASKSCGMQDSILINCNNRNGRGGYFGPQILHQIMYDYRCFLTSSIRVDKNNARRYKSPAQKAGKAHLSSSHCAPRIGSRDSRKWILMYKKLLAACLLGSLSTTAIFAEEPGPNQVVQVENSQLASDKTTSIRISPLRISDGITQLSLNYAVTNKISLGLEGSYVTSPGVFKSKVKEAISSEALAGNLDYTARSYGVRADYALLDCLIMADNTVYLSGGLSKAMIGVKSRIDGTEVRGDILLGRAMIGIQRVQKRLIINIATGISTALSQEYKLKTSSGWGSVDQIEKIGSQKDFEISMGIVF